MSLLKQFKKYLLYIIKSLPILECALCKSNTSNHVCTKCKHLAHRSPSMFSQELSIFACYDYKFPFKNLIKRAKLGQQFTSYSAISQLMIEKIDQYLTTGLFQLPDALIFVPDHPNNYFSRNFNHSELLAGKLGSHFNIPVIHSIKKTKLTKKQKVSSKQERFENVQDSFQVINPEVFLKLSSIAIIDDVYTTGATVSALESTLLAINPQLKIQTITFSSHNQRLQLMNF